ncbi:MAG: DUF3798 domain-containing protein [Oscillospiraceae bacterium]|nr:DUF3798 domain-containing protein [Oscillospiraceae bacterium]
MKKKILCCILALCMILPFAAACVTEAPVVQPPAGDQPPVAPTTPETPPAGEPATPEDPSDPETPEEPAAPPTDEPFPGRIAIITNEISQNEEEFRSAEALVNRYGENKVIHRVWPQQFAQEGEMMISILQELAADPELRAVIINQAVINTNAAVDALLAVRDDVFIAYASAAEDPAEVAMRANLLLDQNNPMRGETIVNQAVAMGAETIAHISFPRHMGVPLLAMRRDNMRDAAERAGINFVELVAPDPMGDGGVPATQLHINQDTPRQVEMLGQNTAFFATNCAMMVPLISQVMATGAMFIEPCCPSPYHGYPTAMGLEAFIPTGEFNDNDEEIMRMVDLPELIELTRAAVAEADMTGRIAGWALPNSMAMTKMGFYYAVEWINGTVPQEHGVIDVDVLRRIVADYASELGIPGVDIALAPLVIDGRTFNHFLLGIVDSIVY